MKKAISCFVLHVFMLLSMWLFLHFSYIYTSRGGVAKLSKGSFCSQEIMHLEFTFSSGGSTTHQWGNYAYEDSLCRHIKEGLIFRVICTEETNAEMFSQILNKGGRFEVFLSECVTADVKITQRNDGKKDGISTTKRFNIHLEMERWNKLTACRNQKFLDGSGDTQRLSLN